MSATGLEVFDQTLQNTNIWLKEIMEDLGPDRQRADHALRAVLHSVRDRLTVEEAAHLSAQLPLLIRGIYFEGWHPAGKPNKDRSIDEFLAHVRERLGGIEPINAETAARSVFRVLQQNVTEREIAHVRDMMGKALQPLWP
jgi:uncharacterized protein (DUF2267 family)